MKELLGALVIAGCVYFGLSLQSRVRVVEENLAALKKAIPPASFGLTEKCASQSAAFFREMDYKPSSLASYTNHYSHTIGKCFILTQTLHSTDKVSISHRVLRDAHERTTLGTLMITHSNLGRFSPRLNICSLEVPGRQAVKCKSEEEFVALVTELMEN